MMVKTSRDMKELKLNLDRIESFFILFLIHCNSQLKLNLDRIERNESNGLGYCVPG